MAIESTQGIVLQQVKYGDTSLICQIYTREYGRKSFLFKGIRSKKSKIHTNILQALYIVNLQFYLKKGHEISLVKEASSDIIFSHFPYDSSKSAQAMFIAEILNICLREEEPNSVLYAFIRNSIEYFDLIDQGSSNFHILFLVKLSKHLGFYPSSKENEDETVFDMKEGIYKDKYSLHPDYMDAVNSELLDRILNSNYEQLSGLELNQSKRNELLEYILKFYSIHIEGIRRLRSFGILREVFENQ
jgi:DNA repair protein RecO (recombination protein O)